MLIPVPIARVCQAAAQPAADLRPAAEEALAFARESQLALEHWAAGLVRTDKLEGLLSQAQHELAAQVQACAAMVQGDRSVAAALRASAERMQELYSELRQAELEGTAYSPYLEVDRLFKVAMNALDGKLAPSQVAGRLQPVASLAYRFEDSMLRFERFYGATPDTQHIRVGLQEIHAGLGAVVEYTRKPERAPLEDGLKLLAAGFQRIHDSLEELEKAAAARQTRWQHLALEELGRACESGDRGLIAATWVSLERVFYGLCASLDGYRGFPYLCLMAMEHALAARSVTDLGQLMNRARENPAAALSELDRALASAIAAVELVNRRRLEELTRYEKAPHFEELREIVYRVQAGEPYQAELTDRVEQFRRRLAELPGGGEMAEIVERQSAALDLMAISPLEGWKALEADVPRLIELKAAAMASAGVEPRPAQSRSCFRCGAANSAEARYCSACRGVLPAVAPVSGPTEYTDISGGEPELPVPRDLKKLEELVQAGDQEAIVREVDVLLARAELLLNDFDQNVVPAANQDQTVAAYAQFFEERVQDLVEGLATMREGSPRRGFEMCRQAGGELMAMKQRLDAARATS